MNHARSFFTLRLALLILSFSLAFLAMPRTAAAQQSITDAEIVDVTDDFCDPDEGDDCEVESVASILDNTTTSEIYTYAATYITSDLLDYGYLAYVEGYLYQDGALFADGYAYDNGTGEAELDGNTPIDTSNGPHAYEMDADSYLYDDEGEYYILSTGVAAIIGAPYISSISPPYAFVGSSGTLTVNGQGFIDPFGGSGTSISASKSGGSGLTVSTGAVSETQATANYTADLTATTGVWSVGVLYSMGSTFVTGVTNFTVGDPSPSISSVSPNQWTAGQTNTAVTITGSGFGSNPQLSIGGAGAFGTITSSSDRGGSGAAQIVANVSVPANSSGGSAAITVTSQGYNGAGFTPAYAGQSSSASSSATVYCGIPSIGSITPSPWVSGQTYNITISGSGFCSDSTVGVSVATGSVSLSSVSIVSSNIITATVQPSATDPTETATVTVSTSADSIGNARTPQGKARLKVASSTANDVGGGVATASVPIDSIQPNVFLADPYLFPNHQFATSDLIAAASSSNTSVEALGMIADGSATAIAVVSSNSPADVTFSSSNGSGDGIATGFTFAAWTNDSFLFNPPSSSSSATYTVTPFQQNGLYYAIALVQAPEQSSSTEFGNGAVYIAAQQVADAVCPSLTHSLGAVCASLGLAPTPVILVHGLWGDATTLNETYDYLLGNTSPPPSAPTIWGSSTLGAKDAVRQICYSKVVPFNAGVDAYGPGIAGTAADCEVTGESSLQSAMLQVWIDLDDAQYVGGRFDIVAHSMGGLVARYHSSNASKDSYIGDRNRNLGDFRTVVTIDTPEAGSEIATYLIYTFAPQTDIQGVVLSWWSGFCGNYIGSVTGEQCLFNAERPLAWTSPAGPGTTSGILSGAVASLIPPGDIPDCNNAIASLSTSGDPNGGNITNVNWFAIASMFPESGPVRPSALRYILNGVVGATNNPTTLSTILNPTSLSQGNDVIVNLVSQTGSAVSAAATSASVVQFQDLAHSSAGAAAIALLRLNGYNYTDDNVTQSPAVDACVAGMLSAGSTACNTAPPADEVVKAMQNILSTPRENPGTTPKDDYKYLASNQMKISAPPSKGVPVAIPFPLTVTIPNSGPRLRLEVIEKGPMGEEIVKGSGQAKVIRDDGTSKVIEIIPAQLGRVTVQVLAGDPDSMTIVQNEIQVDVYPVAKGLKSFDLGVGRRLYLTLDGPRHGERWLKPSLIYLNLGVVNADDAGAIKLTVNQPEDEPVIRLDNSGLIHPLRPGKATIIGDIEGVQDRVEVIVYGTRDDIPKLNRQAR